MERSPHEELVRDAQHRDHAAFEALLSPLIAPGFRLACGMLHDQGLAEDAVQEAALNAWRKLHQLREGADLRPWFLGIVANQCRTVRRGRWWTLLRLPSPAPPGDESQENDAVQGIDLRRALRRLGHRQRLVLLLYFYLDLSVDEIARVGGESPAATRQRLHRSILQLRAQLATPEVTP